jgi:hypothetical protein
MSYYVPNLTARTTSDFAPGDVYVHTQYLLYARPDLPRTYLGSRCIDLGIIVHMGCSELPSHLGDSR